MRRDKYSRETNEETIGEGIFPSLPSMDFNAVDLLKNVAKKVGRKSVKKIAHKTGEKIGRKVTQSKKSKKTGDEIYKTLSRMTKKDELVDRIGKQRSWEHSSRDEMGDETPKTGTEATAAAEAGTAEAGTELGKRANVKSKKKLTKEEINMRVNKLINM